METDIIKYRITTVGASLFAQRKLGQITFADIASALNVDRSVIKMYYETVEDILDSIINTYLENVSDLIIAFVDGVLKPAVKAEKLEILDDRLRFENPQRAVRFCEAMIDHTEAVFEYMIVHGHEYMVLVQEQIHGGKHQDAMKKFLRLFLPDPRNPVFHNARELARKLVIPESQQMMYLQTNLFPVLDYVLHKHAMEKIAKFDEEKHIQAMLRNIRLNNQRHVIGRDVFYLEQ